MELFRQEGAETPTHCLSCADELEAWGIWGNIVPTFFCKTCCSHFHHTDQGTTTSPHTVSQGLALNHYGCTRDDLRKLHFRAAGRDSTKLYLGAEVSFLGQQRMRNRRGRLEDMLGVKLKDIDPLLRVYLLDGYLPMRKQRRASLETVLERYYAIPRVAEILSMCEAADPGGACMLVQGEMDFVTGAVFEFCVAHPDGGPVEFLELREKCHTALRVIGMRLVKILRPAEQSMLLQTPLKDLVLENRFLI